MRLGDGVIIEGLTVRSTAGNGDVAPDADRAGPLVQARCQDKAPDCALAMCQNMRRWDYMLQVTLTGREIHEIWVQPASRVGKCGSHVADRGGERCGRCRGIRGGGYLSINLGGCGECSG